MLRNIWPILVIILLAFIFHFKLFFPPSLYTSADFGRGDLTHFFYPSKVFLAESLKFFHLPLWSDQIFGGFPVFGEGQIGAFYIPNLILFWIFPTWLAFNLGYVLTFFIAGVGTFYYLRFLKLGKLASLFGAIAFSFSFFFIGHIIHYNLIQVASLLPLIILFWEKFLSGRKIFDLAIFAFLVSQSIFASFYQLTFYTLLAIGCLTIFRSWRLTLFEKLKLLAGLAAGVIFAFSLSAIQVLASFEFMKLTLRGFGLGVADLAKFPYPPQNLINFFFPYFFGDPSKANYPPYGPTWGIFWENASYFGIIPIVLAIIGIYLIFRVKSKIFLFWAFLGFFALLFTLGKFGPLFFLIELPPLNFFRVPSRFLLLVIFSTTVITAFALEKITRRFKFKKVLVLTIIAVTFLDLYLLGANYNGGARLQTWLESPDTADFLTSQKDVLRIYSIGQSDNWNHIYKNVSQGWRRERAEAFLSTRAILDPNTNLIWGISQAGGYAAAQTRRSTLVQQIIEEGIDKTGDTIKISSTSAKLLTAAGVSHLVTTKELQDPSFSKVFESNWGNTGSKYYIFANSEKTNLAKIVFNTAKVSTVGELVETLHQTDLERKVIIEEELPLNLKPGPAQIELEKMENMGWKFKANLTSPGLLVVAKSWYPGWRATVNGKQTKVLKANANSQALVLPEGESQIILYYAPYWLVIGGLTSLCSHLLLFFLLALKLLQRKFFLHFSSYLCRNLFKIGCFLGVFKTILIKR
jgi:hypothetical protein